jgi:ssDNA-binding Zn-finger/Zn-ribbon topoisomerase 1
MIRKCPICSKPYEIRTIRNGRVRIFGREYQPDQDATRFDGMRAAFGLYYGPPGFGPYDATGLDRTTVTLWGSEAQYNAVTQEDYVALWPGPFCEDGVFKWEWWHAV